MHRLNLRSLAPVLLLVPVFSACSTTGVSSLAADGRPISADQRFLQQAARDGIAEVEFARFAADRATDPRVTDLAKGILADFETSNAELRKVAADRGLAWPPGLDHEETWDRTSLTRLDGRELHRYYVNLVAEYHIKEVRQFRRALKNTQDGEVRAFVMATLKVLKADREKAQELVPLFGHGRTYGGDTPQ